MSSRVFPFVTMIIAGMAWATGNAGAGFVSGMDLHGICEADASGSGRPLQSAECLGFVLGVADTFDCVETLHGFTWDSKQEADQQKLVKVVIAWLDAHPQHLGYEADGLVAAALSESFPCR